MAGFKPTNNRVSRANCMPLSFTLDTVGPLAQTAEDSRDHQSIITGPDPRDPTTALAPKWDAAKAEAPREGDDHRRAEEFLSRQPRAGCREGLDAAVATFKKLGVKIVEVTLPDQAMVTAAAMAVIAVEAATYHAPWLRERPDDYGAQVRNRLQNGLTYSGIEYLEALRWRAHALEAHLAAIGKCDAVLAPVSRAVAPTIADTDVGGATNAEAVIQGITRLMRPINYLGLPVLVVQAGFGQFDMPIGLQLIGRPFNDETLAALGSRSRA